MRGLKNDTIHVMHNWNGLTHGPVEEQSIIDILDL